MEMKIVYLIPGIAITLAGNILVSFSPGKFRAPLGYRTPLSMKNMDVWRASNRTFGALITAAGILSIITGLVFYYNAGGLASVIVVMIISLILVFIAFTVTERIIKNYYDDNGYRIK